MIAVTCSHCGFSRQVDPARIPDGMVQVTCPECRQAFSFSKPEFDFAPAGGPQPAAEPIAPAVALPAAVAPVTSSTAQPKAGFWLRTGAALLDSVIITLAQLLLGGALIGIVGLLQGGLDQSSAALAEAGSGLFGIVLSLLYYVGFTGYGGQTPGKMAVGIQVIRTDGSPISYGRAALRETVGKFLSTVLLGIGYLMVAFSAQKQGLHDKIADTYVIRR